VLIHSLRSVRRAKRVCRAPCFHLAARAPHLAKLDVQTSDYARLASPPFYLAHLPEQFIALFPVIPRYLSVKKRVRDGALRA
jgi:hypothetical protein